MDKVCYKAIATMIDNVGTTWNVVIYSRYQTESEAVESASRFADQYKEGFPKVVDIQIAYNNGIP